MAAAKGKKNLWNFFENLEGDKVVWIITLMLILVSIVCIFSSTSRLVDTSKTRLDIVRSQLLIVAAGLGLIVICYNIKDIGIFRWAARLGFPLSLILLLMLVSGMHTGFINSIEINGARRILKIGGFQLHVFEVVKVAMVMYLAWAQDALKKGELKGPKKEIWTKVIYLYAPFLITMVLVLTGSNSAAIFIGSLMFLLILLGGGNFRDMMILIAAGVLTITLCLSIYKISDGKAFSRIGTGISRIFENKDLEATVHRYKPKDIEYQKAMDLLRQPYGAKIAIHEGGLLGKGPGESTQRYVVPDMSEDYMFSFILEEYGLWGGLIVMTLYLSLLARGAVIARNCGKDQFAKLSIAGLTLLITGQAYLHIFVNADIGPMTGQTLPLISHGNTAFLCFSIAFGLILSISRIASRRIEKEEMKAVPLVELHESLNDLDRVETLSENDEDPILTDEDYEGI